MVNSDSVEESREEDITQKLVNRNMWVYSKAWWCQWFAVVVGMTVVVLMLYEAGVEAVQADEGVVVVRAGLTVVAGTDSSQ